MELNFWGLNDLNFEVIRSMTVIQEIMDSEQTRESLDVVNPIL